MDNRRYQPPLKAEKAIEYIGNWIKSKYGKIPFAVAGSYAAAVAAYDHDPLFCLEHNDIDVFIEHQGARPTNRWSSRWTLYDLGAIPNLVSTTYHEGVIPGSNIEINLVTLNIDGREGDTLSLEGLIQSFDINAVMVGFFVEWGHFLEEQEQKYQIAYWHKRDDFHKFLDSRILKLVDFGFLERPGSAFIRILCKGQQLKLKYKLPQEQLLLETLGGRCIGEPTMQKLKKLQPDYKREFSTRFLTSSFYSKKFNMQLYKLFRIDDTTI